MSDCFGLLSLLLAKSTIMALSHIANGAAVHIMAEATKRFKNIMTEKKKEKGGAEPSRRPTKANLGQCHKSNSSVIYGSA